MSKDPAFLFYPGDYLRDTQVLSEESQVAYDRIMCEHMRNMCISQQRLKFFIKRLNDEQQDEIMSVLEECPDGFQIPWVAESITKRKAYSESRRKNRASKPDNHMSNISSSYVPHMVNEIENVNDTIIKTKNQDEKIEVEIFPTFEEFWNQFDKKVGKPKCQKIWKQIRQSDRESIVDHLDKYIPSTPDKAYRKNPETYLRNRGWEDEVLEINLNNKANGNSKTNYAALRDELGIAVGQ
jgi:hypothetical protein